MLSWKQLIFNLKRFLNMGVFVCIFVVYVSISLYTKKDVQMYISRVTLSSECFLKLPWQLNGQQTRAISLVC